MTELRAGSATDIGKVRANNQDTLLVAAPLYAVADGMGGHAAGEVASLTAVEALKAAFGDKRAPQDLADAAAAANRSVWDRAQADPKLRGMGTTLVALALVEADGESRLAVINVGDSRMYRLHRGELEQVTTDHSLVQELVELGQISESEAETHPQRHVLTRALGVDPEVEVDLLEVLPVKGDRYLLCSDGLPREVSDSQIASILRRLAAPAQAAKELVAAARAHGGNDNITVVIVDVVDDGDQAAAASAALAVDPGVVIPSGIGGEADDGDGRAPQGTGGRGAARRDARRQARATRRATPAEPTNRPVTLRVVGFVLGILALAGAVVVAVGLYARGSYFVGITGNDLAIYKGRPGGLLWFAPTVAQHTSVPVTDVLASRVADLQSGKEEASLADAVHYVQNLKQEGLDHGIGTTTTTSTTSTTVTSTTATSTTVTSTTVATPTTAAVTPTTAPPAPASPTTAPAAP